MASVRGAALLTAGLTLAGSLLGLVRDVVIAAVFGAGAAVDAFLVAQGLMNLVLGLVAGALAKAAIPVVARAAAAGRPDAGLASVRAALGLAFLVLTLGGVAMWIGAPGVVALLAPGFDADIAALAVELTRVVLAATLLICATNLLAGAGQSLGTFAPAALQGVGFNVVMIAAAALAGPALGAPALAWGFVAGSAVRLLIQLPPLRRAGMRPWPTFRFRDAGLREMLTLVPALLVGSAVSNVNTLVDRGFASTVDDGAVSAVNFGARLVSTVDVLVVATLLAALYPRLAAATRPELRDLVSRGITVLVAALAPLVVALVLVAEPAVRLVFGRGAFDERAVTMTAMVTAVLALGLPALAVREVVTRAAFALGDGRVAVTSAVAGMTVNVVGNAVLVPPFGVRGIAAATVCAGVVAAAVAMHGVHRRHAALPPVTRPLLGIGAAAAFALAAGLVCHHLTDGALVPVGLTVVAAYPLALRWTAPEAFRLLASALRRP